MVFLYVWFVARSFRRTFIRLVESLDSYEPCKAKQRNFSVHRWCCCGCRLTTNQQEDEIKEITYGMANDGTKQTHKTSKWWIASMKSYRRKIHELTCRKLECNIFTVDGNDDEVFWGEKDLQKRMAGRIHENTEYLQQYRVVYRQFGCGILTSNQFRVSFEGFSPVSLSLSFSIDSGLTVNNTRNVFVGLLLLWLRNNVNICWSRMYPKRQANKTNNKSNKNETKNSC